MILDLKWLKRLSYLVLSSVFSSFFSVQSGGKARREGRVGWRQRVVVRSWLCSFPSTSLATVWTVWFDLKS